MSLLPVSLTSTAERAISMYLGWPWLRVSSLDKCIIQRVSTSQTFFIEMEIQMRSHIQGELNQSKCNSCNRFINKCLMFLGAESKKSSKMEIVCLSNSKIGLRSRVEMRQTGMRKRLDKSRISWRSRSILLPKQEIFSRKGRMIFSLS